MRRGRNVNRLLDRWVGVPVLNALASMRRRRCWPPAQVGRIGMLCSPALGDTLLFSGVLADVRAHFPAARLIHFAMPSSLAAAELLPGVDERVVLPLTDPLRCLRLLRAARLDVLLDFSAWQRLTAALTLLSGARFTAGFRTKGQGRGRAYDLATEHRRDQHELENFRDLLRALGMEAEAPPRVCLSSPTVEPLPGEGELLVLHPWASGSRAALREWPVERWIELALRLRSPKTLVVVSGGPADRPRVEALLRALAASGVRAAGLDAGDGFRSLGAVLARARLAVSVNTGVMHLAAILGTPTVALNGPTAAHRWGPVGRCVATVEPEDGSGGYLHLGFEFSRRAEHVMERISVDAVAAAAAALEARCGRRTGEGGA